MPRQVVREGEWVRVPLARENFPVTIQIDHGPTVKAFIDRVREGGQLVTVAAIRCPRLRSGRHTAKARTPDAVYTARFEVP